MTFVARPCPPPPAYWSHLHDIIDPAASRTYTDRIPAIFAQYGGRVPARGGRFQIVEGVSRLFC